MSNKASSLFIFFSGLLCFFYFNIKSALWPSLPIMPFVAFLTFCFYHRSKLTCLWYGFLIGLFLDLIASSHPFGTLLISYTLSTAIMYDRKPLLFEDSIFSVPILSFLFCIILSLTNTFYSYCFEIPISISWRLITQEIMFTPLYNALFVLFAYMIPLHYIRYRFRKRKGFHLKKRPS